MRLTHDHDQSQVVTREKFGNEDNCPFRHPLISRKAARSLLQGRPRHDRHGRGRCCHGRVSIGTIPSSSAAQQQQQRAVRITMTRVGGQSQWRHEWIDGLYWDNHNQHAPTVRHGNGTIRHPVRHAKPRHGRLVLSVRGDTRDGHIDVSNPLGLGQWVCLYVASRYRHHVYCGVG